MSQEPPSSTSLAESQSKLADSGNEPRPEPTPERPLGAIFITSFLALVILLLWFGMYFLDFVRG